MKKILFILLVISLLLILIACANKQSIEGTWTHGDWSVVFYPNSSFENYSGKNLLYSGTYNFDPESGTGSVTITNTQRPITSSLIIKDGKLTIQALDTYTKK